jgi:hypothetical protein
MKYSFKAVITYENEIEADSAEEAEILVFERLADEVTSGQIRIDRFEEEGGDDYRFPMLESVEVRDAEELT